MLFIQSRSRFRHPPDRVNKGFRRCTVGQDHVVVFGLDVIDGEAVVQLGHRHEVNCVAFHQGWRIDRLFIDHHAMICRHGQVGVKQTAPERAHAEADRLRLGTSEQFSNFLATNQLYARAAAIGGPEDIVPRWCLDRFSPANVAIFAPARKQGKLYSLPMLTGPNIGQ